LKSLWGMQCDFEFPFCGVGRAIKLCGDKELCAALGSRPFHCSAAHAATATPRRFSVASGATLWSFYNLRYVWWTIAFDKSSLFLDSSLALSLHSPHHVMYVRCKLYASSAIPKVGRQAEWWDKWQWKLDWRGIFVASWITSGSSEPGAHYTPTHHARISAGESINYHMVVFVAPGTWFSWIQERDILHGFLPALMRWRGLTAEPFNRFYFSFIAPASFFSRKRTFQREHF